MTEKKDLSDSRKCPVCHGGELRLWRDSTGQWNVAVLQVFPLSLLGFGTSTCLQPSEHTEVINDRCDHPENIPGNHGPQDAARILLLWPHWRQNGAPVVELSCSHLVPTSLPQSVAAASFSGLCLTLEAESVETEDVSISSILR